jgi:hypothetical protein
MPRFIPNEMLEKRALTSHPTSNLDQCELKIELRREIGFECFEK